VDAQEYFHNGEPFVTTQWLTNENDIYYNGGNVGIGTDVPSSSFHIKNDDPDIMLEFTPNSPNNMAEIRFQEDTNNYSRIVWEKDTKNMIFQTNGYIGIGTFSPEEKLDVVGNIKANTYYGDKIVLGTEEWKDKVFYPEYELISIDSLSQFVQIYHHLPEIPCEQEIIDEGIDIGKMQTLQMQKIEELTLYIIELNDVIKQQSIEINALKQKNK
ncbi:MAG: hypothetical protein JXL97_17260, partial [Bacteroidales bacterium]|nr:hypothetical protein [Bacteroidales bacterium]